MKNIKRSDLIPWLQNKPYLFPVIGVGLVLYSITVVPLLMTYERKDEIKDIIQSAWQLICLKVED